MIEEKLNATWSSEQIANRLFKGAVCFKTIYRWLYTGKPSRKVEVLRHKGKRQKPQETRGRFNIGTPIGKRPAAVKKRQSFGHWELDTVVSERGKSKGCVATFVERKTRWYVAVKMTDRSADSMEYAIRALHSRLPKHGNDGSQKRIQLLFSTGKGHRDHLLFCGPVFSLAAWKQ